MIGQTLITLEIDPAQTEAWTKRFTLTIAPPEFPAPNNHILVLNNPASSEPQVIELNAHSVANSWFQQELLATLCSYVKDAIAGTEPLGFTMVAAKARAEASDQSEAQRWAFKADREIAQDIDAAVTALSKSMGLTPSSMQQRKMTLLIPASYKEQSAHINQLVAPNYPNLKLLPANHMMTSNQGAFALIICDEGQAGQDAIGRFELHDSIKLLSKEVASNQLALMVAFPPYQLHIFAPEQIAVLTGI